MLKIKLGKAKPLLTEFGSKWNIDYTIIFLSCSKITDVDPR